VLKIVNTEIIKMKIKSRLSDDLIVPEKIYFQMMCCNKVLKKSCFINEVPVTLFRIIN